MPSTLQFFNNRQAGVFPKRIPSGSSHLNFDILLERFACTRNDVFMKFCEHDVSGTPPFVCRFRKDAGGDRDILAVATEEGDISLLNASTTTENILLHSWEVHQNAIFDICWLPDKPALVTASGDNSSSLWDAARGEKLATFCNHVGSVKTVDVCPVQSSIFASGARDGRINVWDMRISKSPVCSQPEITIASVHNPDPEENCRRKSVSKVRSVTSVIFQDEHSLVSAGVGDQTIKVWDLRKTYTLKSKVGKRPTPKHSLFYAGDGCTSLAFDSTRKKLFACCTNSVIYCYDCHSYSSQPISRFYGFKVATYFVKLAVSCHDQYLLCGSSDESAYIWKVSSPGLPVVSLTGHSAETTSVTWHPRDITKLATCGDDNRVLIWKVTAEKENIKDDLFGSAKLVSYDNKIPQSLHSDDSGDENRKLSPTVTSPNNVLKEKTLKHFFSRICCTPTKSTNSTITASEECDRQERLDELLNDEVPRVILSPKKIFNEQIITSVMHKPTSNSDSSDHDVTTTACGEGSSKSPQLKVCEKRPFSHLHESAKKSKKTRQVAKVSPSQRKKSKNFVIPTSKRKQLIFQRLNCHLAACIKNNGCSCCPGM